MAERKTKYELLALDVDGTLVAPDSIVAPELVDAIEAASAAGIRVCIATGRSYIETLPVWQQLRLAAPYDPMIVVGGALVSEPDTGRTLYHKPLQQDVATAFADALADAGYCAMAIVDRWRNDVEYFLTETGDVEDAHRRWFSKMDVQVCRVQRLSDVQDLPDILRVSTVVDFETGPKLADELKQQFDGRLNIHSIVAPNYGVMIVETHAPEANKKTALTYVGQSTMTPLSRMVAVGDDINDLPMIKGAGLGVAMPNATDEVKVAADHVAQNGLAEFIHQLIDGRFD